MVELVFPKTGDDGCHSDEDLQLRFWSRQGHEHDARGITLARVCDACIDEKLSVYRPEVLSDPAYEADEAMGGDE